jgi:hypothetical protein
MEQKKSKINNLSLNLIQLSCGKRYAIIKRTIYWLTYSANIFILLLFYFQYCIEKIEYIFMQHVLK